MTTTPRQPPISPAITAEWRRRREASSEPFPPTATDQPGNGHHPADGQPGNGFHPADDQAGNGQLLRHVNGQPPAGLRRPKWRPPTVPGHGEEPGNGQLRHANQQPGNGFRIPAYVSGSPPPEAAADRFAEAQRAGLTAMMSLATADAPPQLPPIARPRTTEPELPAPPPDPASAVPAQRVPDTAEVALLDRPVDPAAPAPAAPGRAPVDLLAAPARRSGLPTEESPHATVVHDRPVDSVRDHGSVHHGDHNGDPPVLPPRQVDHGPVAGPEYRIPEVTFRRLPYLMWVPLVTLTVGSVLLHRAKLTSHVFESPWLLAMWGISLGFVLVQLVLAWRQKPFTVTRRQRAQLAALKVTVIIPCYNEDPAILDRTIYSLFRQTRPPNHVVVTDDGSTCDYTAVRARWERQQSAATRFTWVRQTNAGKKHAQAAGWARDPDADVFVTIDSDSALDHRAIEEGLKPFAHSDIMSVAGLEMAYNYGTNLLTRAIAARSLAFQLFTMAAQSTANGNVIINPGAFSLYRGWLIRKITPAYLGEKFFGVPVTLGDDTALTMFALCHGRAVHQPTAVSMPVYPETLSHHLRQWTRWMRASTIRTFWRIRYLPITSYGWVFVVYQMWAFFTSVAISVAIPLAWPATKGLAIAGCIALIVWPWAIAVRLATVRRSDQGLGAKLAGIALMPVAAMWYLLVLRQIRFYGIATCYRQGWVTRDKVEVTIREDVLVGEMA